ncbi:zf-TFIIB domain-containing protein [Klebsiella pneumoniae]|uniref:zf-TFIIB domain-containing protein n=1 Tax=Klebsiella pneumoniae TaxID=573 RepID=UPI00259FFFAB|nr:zf-TFIIB domain-containing protein [Klebsiella pneumoniae]EJF0838612.1 hypothetical protein [Salmonella enterica]MCE1279270.1 zf-TFIIB domain-containing protein [Enterobacter hormaechei]QVJ82445.1 hypothetical protein JK004_88 [Cronobacter phage JK004]MCE1315756.1 zf-TFIIB domain-containing protein [Enterobacter hormaechei]MDM7040871.1 zf-TFIIB domain-containing protein [Klebsiella pneumoniae]
MNEETKAHLHSQLVKLGDMIGDGLHLEPGGKWISSEYRKIARALGYSAPRKSHKRNPEGIKEIDRLMAQRVAEEECPSCKALLLEQTRSGSMTAACTRCGGRYKLLRRARVAAK